MFIHYLCPPVANKYLYSFHFPCRHRFGQSAIHSIVIALVTELLPSILCISHYSWRLWIFFFHNVSYLLTCYKIFCVIVWLIFNVLNLLYAQHNLTGSCAIESLCFIFIHSSRMWDIWWSVFVPWSFHINLWLFHYLHRNYAAWWYLYK